MPPIIARGIGSGTDHLVAIYLIVAGILGLAPYVQNAFG
jgi:hypothetical protein